MIVKFVRPRPIVLVQVSVSMGKNGNVINPPGGGNNNALKSFAVRSGLNFARLRLRLSKGSSCRALLRAAFAIELVRLSHGDLRARRSFRGARRVRWYLQTL